MTLTIHDVEQGTEEWFAVRRGIVTASTVGKLLTPTLKVANNDVSRGVTTTLVAERISGYTEDTATTWDMNRGILAEPIARDLYSGHYQHAEEAGFMVRDDWGFEIGYSPDGVVGFEGLIEIKSPRAKSHLNTILADDVPDHYMAQLQCGLLVSGRKWIDYVSYCGGMPLYVKRINADDEWQAAIVDAVEAFEQNAWAITHKYRQVTKDLPPTERLNLLAEVI